MMLRDHLNMQPSQLHNQSFSTAASDNRQEELKGDSMEISFSEEHTFPKFQADDSLKKAKKKKLTPKPLEEDVKMCATSMTGETIPVKVVEVYGNAV